MSHVHEYGATDVPGCFLCAHARAEKAEALLRSLEWSASVGYEGDIQACPSCRGAMPDPEGRVEMWVSRYGHVGHKPECPIGALDTTEAKPKDP